ncbi:uncharacterized protein E0L32_004345 [Thyridium curvatum]|uniref:Clr5 domain-containing protein n=1 Tax=Thyridium curvatum TaxID=1093900 RepID=A0A507B776_9PEZI|nr:uncharacterized protein E0L32_004345 [Thyridium curvatum]TPX15647.1 hypothetical protein E0L32_004345 [Thyridium curvatum]
MERKNALRTEGNKLDEHEDEILQLYKNKKLDDVIKEINSKYKIHASKTQYRKRVEKWHGKKYASRKDVLAWEQAGRKLRDRALHNKASIVIWNGSIISDPAIQQRVHRHTGPRLADKFTIGGRGEDNPNESTIVVIY